MNASQRLIKQVLKVLKDMFLKCSCHLESAHARVGGAVACDCENQSLGLREEDFL